MTSSTSRTKTLRVALVLALLGVAVALSACGSSASSQGASTSTASQSTAAPSDTTQQPSDTTAAQPSDTTGSQSTGGAAAQDTSGLSSAEKGPTSKPVTKLVIKDLVVGKGAAVKAGDSVSVDYTGWLADGTRFDTSVGRSAFPVQVGAGQVIKGWDEGLVGMKVGGIRQLIIPPDMGYGPSGYPPTIPANATLIFQVKLHSIQ